MTEHDTPSTARTEAWATYAKHVGISAAFAAVPNGSSRLAYEAGWAAALAQVREELKALRKVRVPVLGAYFLTVDRADAMAVVDRLEGKQ